MINKKIGVYILLRIYTQLDMQCAKKLWFEKSKRNSILIAYYWDQGRFITLADAVITLIIKNSSRQH